MDKQQQLALLQKERIVAILRSEKSDQLVSVAEALVAGGISILEITFTVPNALQVIEAVADQLGDKILLGAGTVLDSEMAQSAMSAGAEFFVAPGTSVEVIETCRRAGKCVFPGAFTPTEVIKAWDAGCDAVKVFPCDVVGAQHIKALKGPLPHIPMIPTGGVNRETAKGFLDAGALAVGVGSSLAPKEAVASGDFETIVKSARAFVNALQ
jgi:2-dehydro-3-deoxyphosphogluconate aldolase/(4S)-4-hydroxy-2-oxoglutarate aldolase